VPSPEVLRARAHAIEAHWPLPARKWLKVLRHGVPVVDSSSENEG